MNGAPKLRDAKCHHQIGPVHVRHEHGIVDVYCAGCDTVLSTWIASPAESEAIELRGVIGDVRHHLYRAHPNVDPRGTDTLRTCAWQLANVERNGSADFLDAGATSDRSTALSRWRPGPQLLSLYPPPPTST